MDNPKFGFQLWPFQSKCNEYYGVPGNSSGTNFSSRWYNENIVTVKSPWLLWNGFSHTTHIPFHKKCAPALAHVLNSVWQKCDQSQDEIERRNYHIFSGSLVYRKMRNGSRLSMHSYGCAIDFDAPENMLGSHKHRFTHDELLLEEFRMVGAVCGIDWRGNSVDAMHIQFARVG